MNEATRQSASGTMTWLFLLVAGGLIAPLSLFVHDFMLETLKVPYPKTLDLPIAIKFLSELARFFALATICRLSRPKLDGISRATAAQYSVQDNLGTASNVATVSIEVTAPPSGGGGGGAMGLLELVALAGLVLIARKNGSEGRWLTLPDLTFRVLASEALAGGSVCWPASTLFVPRPTA
jgi:hypothetical protein